MESLPRIDDAEQAPPPDLMAAYHERQVVVFGVPGTIKDLAGMCPVDLSDPRITTEMKNAFVISVMNECSQEINPEHESLFTAEINKQGQERKFSIAEAPKETTIESVLVKPQAEVVTVPIESKADLPPAQTKQRAIDAATTETLLPRAVIETVIEVPSVELLVHQAETIQHAEEIYTIKESRRTIPEQIIYDTHDEVKSKQAITVGETTVFSASERGDVGPTEINELAVEVEDVPVVDVLHDMLIPIIPVEIDTAEAWAEITQANSYDTVLTPSQEVVLNPIETWAAELAKEPLDIYEDFTVALQLFADLDARFMVTSAANAEAGIDSADNAEIDESQPSPPLIDALAERLAALNDEEKEPVALIIRDIVGAVHGLHILEARGANTEMMDMVTAQLQELCVALFESIGIDYGPTDVTSFMKILSQPEFSFQNAVESVPDIDLETAGTHEGKRHFQALSDGVATIEELLQQALGRFALRRGQLAEVVDLAA